MSALVVHARGQAMALPLAEVIEIMRPLPITPLGDQPRHVLGVAVVRGRPTPVVDLGLLCGSTLDLPTTRFVTVHVGRRQAALAVGEVRGIRTVRLERIDGEPAVGSLHAGPGLVESLTTLDGAPLLVLRTLRLLGEEG